jgi:signal peptide peptidase SppA
MLDLKRYLAQFDMRPVLLSQRFSKSAFTLLGDAKEEDAGRHAHVAAGVYGGQWQQDSKPYAFASGVAIIPVTGVLLNRFPASYSFATGYGFIRNMLSMAMADPDVEGIVLDVNSPGGMVQGCFELCDFIYAARDIKPIASVVDANATSAAYAIASSASKMIATRSADIGSVGVLLMHVNVGPMFEEAGIEITYVYAGDHKVDGNPYEKLSASVKRDLQESINETYDEFTSLVARNRGLDEKVVRDTEAQIYSAEDAKQLGLIDSVATPSEALQAFVDGLSGSISTVGDLNMSTEKKPGAEATADVPDQNAIEQAAKTAKANERARIKAINELPEAKDRSALANHLAMNTELSVEDAKGILGAAPVVKAAEPAKEEPTAKGSAFERAMNSDKHPEISAGDGKGEQEDETTEARVARITGNYQKATGSKLKTVN